MKDIKWTNKEIKKVQNLLNNKRYEEEVDDFTTGILLGLNKALNILDQLDETETLSQEWLVEHSYNVHLLGTPDVEIVAVPRDDLEGLLVPKKELPVIPKFVADYINRKKKGGNGLDGAFTYIKAYGWDDESSYDYEVYKWLGVGSNDETFARAWLDGYMVEEEQKTH